jgi:DnaJ-class molecular chaperone
MSVSDIKLFDVVEAMNGVKNGLQVDTCEGCQGVPINEYTDETCLTCYGSGVCVTGNLKKE